MCEIPNVFILTFEMLSLGDKFYEVQTISLAYEQEEGAREKPELLPGLPEDKKLFHLRDSQVCQIARRGRTETVCKRQPGSWSLAAARNATKACSRTNGVQ